jgi:hypothetical protein
MTNSLLLGKGKENQEAQSKEQAMELGKRAVACKHWRWMIGMRAIKQCSRWFRLEETRKRLTGDWADALPDLEDHATTGCLLALVREAWPAAPASTNYHGCYDPQRGHYHVWTCYYCTGTSWEQAIGDSEVEALVDALEAAP